MSAYECWVGCARTIGAWGVLWTGDTGEVFERRLTPGLWGDRRLAGSSAGTGGCDL